MAHDVFICHSSVDKPVADATVAALEQQGIRCWIAPRDVQAGVSYGESIVNAISNAKVMVLIFSATANKSQQVEREIERAVHHNLPLIPLRIENVAPERGLEYFLATPHWLDAITPPLEQHLGRLATQIKALLGRTEPEGGDAPVAAAAVGAAAAAPLAAAAATAPHGTATAPASTTTPPRRPGGNLLAPIAIGVVAVAVLVLAAVIFIKPSGGATNTAAANAAATNGTAASANALAAANATAATNTAAINAAATNTAAANATPPAQAAATPAPAPATPAPTRVAATPAPPTSSCEVAAPEPPLKLHERPAGPVAGMVVNGRHVRIASRGVGPRGGPWLYIETDDGGPSKSGWVPAETIRCGGVAEAAPVRRAVRGMR